MENITQGQWFRGPSADLGVEIEQSLRFNSSGFLTRAQSAPLLNTDRTFTFSTWFKHGDMGETNIFGIHHTGSDNWILAYTTSGTTYSAFLSRDSSGWQHYDSTQKFRDPNAWYHIFITCSSGVMTMRVNNVLRGGTVTQNHSMDRTFVIGAENTNGGSPMDGYLAETYFIQGTVLDAVNDGFIRENGDGIYVPSTPTISDYGTNGWHLTYDSSQTNGIGHDSSGKGNHFTASGFETTAIGTSNFDNDIDYQDTPTNNTATLNPLVRTYHTVSDGNLQWDQASAYDQYFSVASMRMDQPIYGEMTALENTNGSYPGWGVCNEFKAVNVYQGYDIGGQGIATDPNSVHCLRNGGKYAKATYSSPGNLGGPTWSAGDTVRWTFNPSNGECRTAVNGGNFFTWHTFTSSEVDDEGYKYFCAAACNTSGAVNFGNRPFVYSIPTGFKTLQVNEIAEPTVKNGEDYFKALTYTGDGQSSQAITGLDFKPDLVWIKPRSVVDNHRIIDSVLEIGGGTLASNSTDSKSGQNVLSSFDTGGFTLSGSDSGWNGNTSTYVAWCWKAGGAPTTDNTENAGDAQTAGSVKKDGSNASFATGTIAVKKMSVNTTAGFSIVEYQGTGSAGTFPHGLGAIPEWAILKRHDGTGSWSVYHKSMGNQNKMDLENSGQMSAFGTGNDFWNSTTPTDQVFSIGVAGAHNTNTENYIAYLWAPVEGYSSFGEYTGNGNADGAFIYTGFRPAYVMVKTKSGANGSWSIYDNGRQPTNPNNNTLVADSTAADVTSGNDMDFLSNGFKCRDNGSINNGSGNVYLYMAFAEHPFGGVNTPPATAR